MPKFSERFLEKYSNDDRLEYSLNEEKKKQEWTDENYSFLVKI